MFTKHFFFPFGVGRCEIHTEGDAISAVQHLIGYLPDPGYVVVIGTVARHPALSATIPLDDLVPLVTQLRADLPSRPVDSVEIIGFGVPATIANAVQHCAGQLAAAEIPIAHALCCAGGRYWTIDDIGPGEPEVLTLAGTAFDRCARELGSLPAEDTDDLRRRLAPEAGTTAQAVARGVAAAESMLLRRRARGWPHRAAVDFFYQSLADCAGARAAGRPLTPEQAAIVCVTLDDVRMRQLAISLSLQDDTGTAIGMWSDLTRLAPPEHRSLAATLLALAALTANDQGRVDAALAIAQSGEIDGRLLPSVASLAADGLGTTPMPPGGLSEVMDALYKASFARFEVQQVLDLAQAAVGPRTGHGKLVWQGSTVTRTGIPAAVQVAHAQEAHDPVDRFEAPESGVSIAIDDELLSLLRRSVDARARELQLLWSGDDLLIATSTASLATLTPRRRP